MPGEGIAHGIKRAGADITKHHADGANCHLGQTGLMGGAVMRDGRVDVAISNFRVGMRLTHCDPCCARLGDLAAYLTLR